MIVKHNLKKVLIIYSISVDYIYKKKPIIVFPSYHFYNQPTKAGPGMLGRHVSNELNLLLQA